MLRTCLLSAVLAAIAFAGACSCRAQSAPSLDPKTIDFDASASPVAPAPADFHGGISVNPAGQTLGVNSRYLLLDGKPWLPVMGEFHYSRVPESQWEEELLKMKAAGVQIVATYIFWIHQEEVQGQFDWSSETLVKSAVRAGSLH